MASGASSSATAGRRDALVFAAGIAGALALAAALGLPALDAPGLYYDEAIQAWPAAEFARGSPQPVGLPGATSVPLAGRWLPVLTQPYMGALKSQLLIPVFAAFGASSETLRAATFAWGLAGLALAMLFARRLLGTAVALAAGALLAVDPAFLFVSRHDWGSFALGLVCRCAGLWIALAGFERRSAARLAAAGVALGLGVYNKLDAGVMLAAVAAAAVLAAPRDARKRLWQHPRALAALAAGLALGAAPLLAGGPRAARGVARTLGDPGGLAHELPEKLAMWSALLDGSYFQRLMLAGGRFEDLAAVSGAAAGLLAPALAASAWLLAAGLARRRPWGRPERARAFALAALALGIAALLATPRAARVHHGLNVFPFPHLVVAAAATDLWRAAGARRALAGLGLAALLASAVRADLATRAELAEHHGRGRWSDALGRLARELAAEPGLRVVSLDWGFHAPLGLLAPGLDLREPIWALRGPPGSAAPIAGDARTLYLVQDPRYRVFAWGDDLLAAVARLPAGSAEVRAHPDRRGETALLSVRIRHPHRLVRRAALEVVLE